MMTVRVRRAWTTAGSRKARMPLLTASTPVIAVQPLAKACIRSQRLAVASASGKAGGSTIGVGCQPCIAALTIPRPITPSIEARNR